MKKNICIYGKKNNIKNPRIGICVSKKYINKSFNRNKFKRIVRESFRIKKNNLPNMDFIIKINSKLKNIKNKHIFKILEILWNQYYF
ncbi:ribonuclease P protein component [Sodalis-like secondary symbiont of Drepanosiphum platanoidis]|uniref:ribonuclease P protein component n=1 Tax=Sodalis-like secondary symbiont of Drepanosiphum platanoidis TaxID=2994493 RepID=UPI003463ECA7